MKTKLYVVFGVVVFLSGSSSICADEKSAAPKIVQDVYPGLTWGALAYASDSG